MIWKLLHDLKKSQTRRDALDVFFFGHLRGCTKQLGLMYQDLNEQQKLPWADNTFDVATLALSVSWRMMRSNNSDGMMREETPPWESRKSLHKTSKLQTLCAAKVQYLTKPREVFAEMQRVLKPGGMAVVIFSHRSFIEKARWNPSESQC